MQFSWHVARTLGIRDLAALEREKTAGVCSSMAKAAMLVDVLGFGTAHPLFSGAVDDFVALYSGLSTLCTSASIYDYVLPA